MFKELKQKWQKRPKRKQRISYGRKIRYNWNVIESLNLDFGITRDNCFVDNNGYLRRRSDNRLCHRDIAYTHVYRRGSFNNKFSVYDVHHKDGDKFNNDPYNLEIVFREDHELEHGKILYEDGIKYIKLVPANRHRKQTRKAILIGGKRGAWYPKSQLITRNGQIYATEWIVKRKNSWN